MESRNFHFCDSDSLDLEKLCFRVTYEVWKNYQCPICYNLVEKPRKC
jgi:hypothetical protein